MSGYVYPKSGRNSRRKAGQKREYMFLDSIQKNGWIFSFEFFAMALTYLL